MSALDQIKSYRQKFDKNRLDALEYTEMQREDYGKYRTAAGNRTAAAHSGYDSERDYVSGLNRQGEMADIRSRLAGRGPGKVNHSYGGTSFAEGDTSMPQHPQSMRSLRGGQGDDDATNYQMGRAQLETAQANARRTKYAADDAEWANSDYQQDKTNTRALDKLRSEGVVKR